MIAIAASVVTVLSACSGVPSIEEVVRPGSPIRISGSGTTQPLLRVLTDAYPVADVEFAYLPGLHSGGGIEGVRRGDLDLGAVSRGFEGDEASYGLDLTVLATDALAVAVHPSSEVDNLTSRDLRDIYGGVIRNWADLGGPDLPITLLDRPEEESAKKILRTSVLGDDFVVADHAVQMYYEADMLDAIQASRGSIGYVSYGLGVTSDADVVYVALDGVVPSVETVSDGSYQMTRELGVVTSPDARQEVSDFLDWATGEEAGALLAENGYGPVSVR
jgi:phosphate transport system substrate-binding protein